MLQNNTAIGSLLFRQNQLFLGTSGNGIWWGNTKEPYNFSKLSGQKSPYSENIYQLIFDAEDNLWAGSERGVDKIVLDPSNTVIDVFHFSRNEGFLGIETCLNAVDKDKHGNLWFGAIYGLTQYSVSQNTKETFPPKLHLETVVVGDKPLDSLDFKIYKKGISELQLSPKQTQMTFSYKAVDLNHPQDMEYRFKLNDGQWSLWSPIHQQNFAGLEYGRHQFYAQARNYRWEESEPLTFHFFIDSPLHKKPWFQWTVLALCLLILGLFAWLYIRKLQRKNKEEQERLQIENHLLSLEHKALRLQMNPHFIFNVLNGIKAMGVHNPEKMNTTINSFATLLRETLYNSRRDEISLQEEVQTLEHYIKVEQLMAPATFTYAINVNSELDPQEILIPPMLIQPFVENAIRHGILKGKQAGVLQIEFKTDTSFLYCSVTDNGIGIFTSQQAKTKTDHQSMALQVTKERLASISGKNALEIKELKKEDQTVAGTAITFKIPLETDY